MSSFRSARPPGVLVAADGVVRAITASLPDKVKPGLEYVECDAATGRELLRAEGPRPELPGSPVLRQRIVEAGSGLFWFARGRTPSGGKHDFWSRSARPELGLWEPVRPLEPADAYSGDFDLLSARGRLMVAHQAPGGMRALASGDGGATLKLGEFDPAPGWASSNPVLGQCGKEFLLAYVDAEGSSPERPAGIRLYASVDGLRWKARRYRRAILTMCRSLGLVATESSACLVAYDESEGVITLRLPL